MRDRGNVEESKRILSMGKKSFGELPVSLKIAIPMFFISHLFAFVLGVLLIYFFYNSFGSGFIDLGVFVIFSIIGLFAIIFGLNMLRLDIKNLKQRHWSWFHSIWESSFRQMAS